MRQCSQTWHKATAVGDTTKAYFLDIFGCHSFKEIIKIAVFFRIIRYVHKKFDHEDNSLELNKNHYVLNSIISGEKCMVYF